MSPSEKKGYEALHQLIADRLEDARNEYEVDLAWDAADELAVLTNGAVTHAQFLTEEEAQ